ncbi:MAG: tRNA (adenosine(37)-N6)-threonylcarbamoyltransferase complex transferase subunit TsaD [Bdellovibrionota bacterium]|jgi:N6-L-threonylcarbamoyladenine synthase
MIVLGIESSCDETAISLFECAPSENGVTPRLLGEKVASQEDVHVIYGGVVPELAAREHLRNLPILVSALCKEQNISIKEIDAIGVTKGPGLKGCLLMGVCFAEGLSLALQIPLIGINHIEAHLSAALLDNPELDFPFLALIVSGGHTEIVYAKALGEYQILAQTSDDAAGETFDKSANLLGFPYPGGAKLAKLADTVTSSPFKLPRVMREAAGFSFSGLKTAISLLIAEVKDQYGEDLPLAELAYTIQDSIVDALVFKLKKALKEHDVKKVAVVGGVSANRCLRRTIQSLPNISVYFPDFSHSVDNGAMVGYLACKRLMRGEKSQLNSSVLARWSIEDLS